MKIEFTTNDANNFFLPEQEIDAQSSYLLSQQAEALGDINKQFTYLLRATPKQRRKVFGNLSVDYKRAIKFSVMESAMEETF